MTTLASPRSKSISNSILSLLPSPCRATALSAARRLDKIDLEMELVSRKEIRPRTKPQSFCVRRLFDDLTFTRYASKKNKT